MLLTPALAGVWLLGRRLTETLDGWPEGRALVAPAAACASFIVAVGIVGRLTGSFVIGLCVGTLALAAAGVAWTVRSARGGPGPDRPASPSRRAMLLSGLVAAIPVAFLTLCADFWDDFNAIGHRSLIAQFQNGVFPPRHQVFPEYPFRYHYGFNLVAAALTGLLRVSVAGAIDLLVIVGFVWAWCLAWRLGERLTRSGRGHWTALATLYGGGAFFWFILHADWASQGAVGVQIGGNRINFPLVMYFFQKPFALGVPLALAVLLVASVAPEEGRWRRRSLLLGVLLGALYLVQEALFVTVGLSLAAHDLLAERRARALVAPALGIVLAIALGGVLFAAMPGEHGSLLRLRLWPAQHAPGGVLTWYLLTTGLLLPLGVLGLLVMPALRTLLALLMAGSFAAPLFFEDPHSWDIVKLATVGQMAAGLAGGSALAWLAEKKSTWRSSALAASVLLLVASPLGYLGYWIREVVRPTPEIGRPLAMQRDLPKSAEWDALIGWLRRRAPADGAVYTSNPRLVQQVLLAGLHSAGPPRWNDLQFGIPQLRITRREALLKEVPSEARRWMDEGVFWVIVRADEPLAPVVQRWEADGRARRVRAAGPWLLYRLKR